MKMTRRNKLDWANSFLFFRAVLLLLLALAAVALDFFWAGKLLLGAALAVYVLSKAVRLAEIVCFMPEANILQRVYLAIVNFVLGGGVLLILIYLVKKHSGG